MTTIASAIEMFSVMNRSSRTGGSGTIIITTTSTTSAGGDQVGVLRDLLEGAVHAAAFLLAVR